MKCLPIRTRVPRVPRRVRLLRGRRRRSLSLLCLALAQSRVLRGHGREVLKNWVSDVNKPQYWKKHGLKGCVNLMNVFGIHATFVIAFRQFQKCFIDSEMKPLLNWFEQIVTWIPLLKLYNHKGCMNPKHIREIHAAFQSNESGQSVI